MSWTVTKAETKVNGVPEQVCTDAAIVAVGDKIYSFGGFNTDVAYPDLSSDTHLDVHIMQTDDYTWRVLKTPDCSSSQYKEIPAIRNGHTAVVHNNMVYIWGGFLIPSGRCEDALYYFDTETHLWSRPSIHGVKPVKRGCHFAFVINDAMYIFGGIGSPMISQKIYEDVYKLDLISFQWSFVRTRGETPTCIYESLQSATAINNCIYFFGGRARESSGDIIIEDGTGYDQVNIFDTQISSWIRPEVNGYRPVGRWGHSAFGYMGQLLIFGGCSGINSQEKYYNDLVRYDPESRCWSLLKPTGNGPCPRGRHSCCVIGDRIFLLGGTGREPVYKDQGLDAASLECIGHRITDLNDLYVLEFGPSLKTLAIMKVLELKLNLDGLPETIRALIKAMTVTTPILQL